jgi:molecular chaperone DnaJ
LCRLPWEIPLPSPRFNGETDLDDPQGTQPGDIFRLRGEGIPSLRNGHRGDQIVQVNVKTPTNLNKKQVALLKEFASLEEGKFTSKLKNILKSGPTRAAN